MIEGDDHPWGLLEQLAAARVDLLNILVWQQTKDGSKGKNQPQPIRRPGISAPDNRYGKQAIPMDEMADWLGWSQELATPQPVQPVDKTGRRRDSKGRFTKI